MEMRCSGAGEADDVIEADMLIDEGSLKLL
jgi:hypothetical protein